jgi:uncharacterized protein YndB with AHSA1/START domain
VPDVLTMQVRLAAPPAAVYRALTEPTAMRVWLAEHAETSLPQHRFDFWGRFTPQGERGRQALIAAEQDRSLSFTWTLDGEHTTVAIRLDPYGTDHTTLRLRQDGLPTLEELMAPRGRRDGLHAMHTFWGLALANLAEYVEGRPLIPKADFSPSRSSEIRVQLAIAAAPQAVFASLIDPERIRRWFGWEAAVEPHVGGRMTLGVDGEISEFEPGKTLVYADKDGAVVRWELADSDGKTFLTFVQSGYADDEWDNAAQHEAGWLGSLAELKRMHELGDAWTPLTTELPTGTQPGDDSDA